MTADGSVLREDRIEITGSIFSISVEPGGMDGEDRLIGVRVYVWDATSRVDGIGWVGFNAGEVEVPEHSISGGGSDDAGSLTGIDSEPQTKEES